MFAGSLRGVTQTAPLAIYERFSTDFPAAIALAAVLLAVSAAVLGAVKLASRPGQHAALRA
jgi:molybdate transport system permease protein